MAWERRARGTLYYTRSRREGDRVLREYVGCGEKGEQAARADAEARSERERRRAEAAVECARFEEALAALDALCEETDTLVATALVLAGCHQHKREWRRKRDGRAGERSSG